MDYYKKKLNRFILSIVHTWSLDRWLACCRDRWGELIKTREVLSDNSSYLSLDRWLACCRDRWGELIKPGQVLAGDSSYLVAIGVQDILHARLTTTGVIETAFTFKGYNFRCVIYAWSGDNLGRCKHPETAVTPRAWTVTIRTQNFWVFLMSTTGVDINHDSQHGKYCQQLLLQ